MRRGISDIEGPLIKAPIEDNLNPRRLENTSVFNIIENYLVAEKDDVVPLHISENNNKSLGNSTITMFESFVVVDKHQSLDNSPLIKAQTPKTANKNLHLPISSEKNASKMNWHGQMGVHSNCAENSFNRINNLSLNNKLKATMFGVESYVFVPVPQSVPRSLPCVDFEEIDAINHKTFHDVRKVRKRGSSKDKIYYEKSEKNNPYPIRYRLESFSHSCFKFLDPQLVSASTKALYNEDYCYIAVISQEIREFVPYAEDRLTKIDLDTSYLKYYSIQDMDYFDENAPYPAISEIEIIKLNEKFRQLKHTKDLQSRPQITCNILERYRMMKGLAGGLFYSFGLYDRDRHARNMDKHGRQIDFDETLAPISTKYKDTSILEIARGRLVKQDPKLLGITVENLTNFPDITHDFRWWPTQSWEALDIFKPWFANAYSKKDVKLFKKINKNPVFMHHYFRSMLKVSLTTSKMWHTLATLHFEEGNDNECNQTIKEIDQFFAKLLTDLRKIAPEVPAYRAFIAEYGDYVFEKILKYFKKIGSGFMHKSDNKKLKLAKEFHNFIADQYPKSNLHDIPMMQMLHNIYDIIYENKKASTVFPNLFGLDKEAEAFRYRHVVEIAKVKNYLTQIINITELEKHFAEVKSSCETKSTYKRSWFSGC